jgi:hypothetical protein
MKRRYWIAAGSMAFTGLAVLLFTKEVCACGKVPFYELVADVGWLEATKRLLGELF